MDKKVTIQDVARVAGVSKSTVSFILNGREDQRISEKTKKKVLQVINMLNFRPSVYAKNLRGAQTNLIAFYLPDGLPFLEKAAELDFFEKLSQALQSSRYHAILFHSLDQSIKMADAIVAHNVSKNDFLSLGENNFIPLIAVDCIVNDPLFFEINTDYPALKAKADDFFQGDYTYVCRPPKDKSVQTEIKNTFSRYLFLTSVSQLHTIKDKNLLLSEPVIKELLSETGAHAVCLPDALFSAKLEKTIDCIRFAVSHEDKEEHSFKI